MILTKKLRTILRWVHIVLGLVIMCYIYSPFHERPGFQIFVKWIALPVITLSGIWIWQFKLVNRRLGLRDGAATGEG